MKNQDSITFIIPTIGRKTLKNTIDSIINQTIKKWNAIIIFDGISSNINISDKRIKILETNKKGLDVNSAGLVRNYGISMAKSKWVAFIDDDDIISQDYLETFYKELEENSELDLDVIIFRMKLEDRIIPKLNTDNFYLCDVGISYVMKKEIFDSGIKFIPDGAEDFLHLDNIRKSGYKIMISPYIKYYVRIENFDINSIEDNNQLGNRVFINIENKFINFMGYFLYHFYKEVIYED
jgi:glycosyltransferase involved in cell wall biosynthesis